MSITTADKAQIALDFAMSEGPAPHDLKVACMTTFLAELLENGNVSIDNGWKPVEYPVGSIVEDMATEALATDECRIYGKSADGSKVMIYIVLDFGQPVCEMVCDHSANEATETLVKRHFG